MSGQRVAVLAVRIFALFVAFQGLYGLLRALEFEISTGFNELNSILLTGQSSSLVVISLGGIIWARADAVAARALGQPRQSQAEADLAAANDKIRVNLSGLDAHAIAFTLLGVYILGHGVARALQALGIWIESFAVVEHESSGGTVSFFNSLPSDARAVAIYAAVYIAIGLSLALGAQALASSFRRIWWGSRGVVRGRRLEIVDEMDVVRANLRIEEVADGEEDVVLSFFDDEDHTRIRLGTEGGGSPLLQFSDESGRAVLRIPATETEQPSQEDSLDGPEIPS